MLKSDKDMFCNHLTPLPGKLDKCFPGLKISEYEWIRYSFASTEISGLSLPEKEGPEEHGNDTRTVT
jgi:hypothetical protein